MRIRMDAKLLLYGAVFVLSLGVVAQPSLAGPCTEQREAPGIFVPGQGCIDVAFGYQYQHFSVLGTRFNTDAYSMDVGVHLVDLVTGAVGRLTLGAEGNIVAGFDGHTSGSPSLDAKSLFFGAGPHIAIESNSRFEPWIHGLVGWQHYRFTQTATLGSNSALGYMVGVGLDVRLKRAIYWRFQGDYVGTHFNSGLQTNYSAGTGVVLYF